MPTAGPHEQRVVVGKVAGVFGVQGWLKIYSYTRPKENILTYSPWLMTAKNAVITAALLNSKTQGKGLIARLQAVTDADMAAALVGAEISIAAEQLPVLAAGQHYWADLLQLDVFNLAGQKLGKVTQIKETGANDVLVVQGKQRILIPWVNELYIKAVDLAGKSLLVDWEQDD